MWDAYFCIQGACVCDMIVVSIGKRFFEELNPEEMTYIAIYLFSVNTFTPIERCAIIFVIVQVGKLLIGQKIQKLQNHARRNRSLIGQ